MTAIRKELTDLLFEVYGSKLSEKTEEKELFDLLLKEFFKDESKHDTPEKETIGSLVEEYLHEKSSLSQHTEWYNKNALLADSRMLMTLINNFSLENFLMEKRGYLSKEAKAEVIKLNKFLNTCRGIEIKKTPYGEHCNYCVYFDDIPKNCECYSIVKKIRRLADLINLYDNV